MTDNPSSPTTYTPPVDQLLSIGDARELRRKTLGQRRDHNWPDYLEHGLNSDHVPVLIEMIHDQDLRWADSESDEVWAPIHAWRTLGQLCDVEAVDALLGLLHEIDDHQDDWAGEEIPLVLGMIGAAAIEAVREYLTDAKHGLWARVAAAHSLSEIRQHHPESHNDCVTVLIEAFEDFQQNDETLNAFLLSYLADLKAHAVVPLAELAYEAVRVDISVLGDFEDFQIELGLLEKRLTPPPRYQKWMPELDFLLDKEGNLRTPDPQIDPEDNEIAHLREAKRLEKERKKKDKKKRKQAKKRRK